MSFFTPSAKFMVAIISFRKQVVKLIPLTDYPEDEELEKEQEREDQDNAKRQLELLQKTGNRYVQLFHLN